MALAPQLKAPCRMLALSRLEKSGPAAPQRPVPDPPEGHPPSALAWPAQSGPPLHRPQQLAPAVEKDPAGVGADSSAGFSLQLLWTDSILRSVADCVQQTHQEAFDNHFAAAEHSMRAMLRWAPAQHLRCAKGLCPGYPAMCPSKMFAHPGHHLVPCSRPWCSPGLSLSGRMSPMA